MQDECVVQAGFRRGVFLSILQRRGTVPVDAARSKNMLVAFVVTTIGISLMAELVLTVDDVDGLET